MDLKSRPQPGTSPQATKPVVTSAEAAINARYKKESSTPRPQIVMSARDAVNAAAKQAGTQHTKSAANLHHGSIQRSMESTRTSASALLRRANDGTKVETRMGSLDPLAKAQPLGTQKHSEREIPVVRTSLKLGSAARPKANPVVLPPNSRMANIARPVGSAPAPKPISSKLSKLLRRNAIDAQIVQPNGLDEGTAPKALASGKPLAPETPNNALTVKIIPSGANPSAEPSVSKRSPKASSLRDPQMLSGARRVGRSPKTRMQSLSRKAQTAEALGMASARSPRFRTKPKDFSANQPTPIAADSSYVMTEPPKLNVKKRSANTNPDELGVIESYRPEKVPQPIGDKAPTGSIKAQQVASGHVSAAPELPDIKAENTSNYSFSKKKSAPDNNRYVLGGESPFLKSVNVEKRPLSDNPQKLNPKVERKTVSALPEGSKSTNKSKSGRKNHYAKKPTSVAHQETPVRPTVIVPSNRRSKAPLMFLILITVILGAAVGAAAYLCFFQ